jgi:hypothetical protein
MATTMVDSWAVDLATLGPIYPWVGTEVVLWVIGMALWIGWHVWQGRFESRTYGAELQRLNSPDKIERAMREQRLEERSRRAPKPPIAVGDIDAGRHLR